MNENNTTETSKREVKKHVVAGVGTAAAAVIASVAESVSDPAPAQAGPTAETEILDGVTYDASIQEESLASAQASSSSEKEDAVEEASVAIAGHHHHVAPQTISSNAAETNTAIAADQAAIDHQTDDGYSDDIVIISDGNETTVEGVEAAVAIEDDDIQIVNVISDSDDAYEEEELENVTYADYDGPDAPDYIGQDDSDSKAGTYGSDDFAALEMPDYINNANIDSFTEPA